MEIVETPKIDLRLWHLRDTDLALEDEIRKDLVEMRDLDITEVLMVTRMSTSHLILHQARILGIVARPYSYIMLNLVGIITYGATY